MFFSLSIGIGGIRSGVGKTYLIEILIAELKRRYGTALKIFAAKYTRTSLYSCIIKDSSVISQSGKDTSRMKKAGADFVYWVKSTDKDLPEIGNNLKNIIHNIMEDISSNKNTVLNCNTKYVLIIEGNSLVRIMRPDVIIFLKDDIKDNIKPSAKSVIEIADIVLKKPYNLEDVMVEIENVEIKKKIHQLLQERSKSGRITCTEARKIAEELAVPYIEVGRIANELNIKIRKCELGCF